MRPRGCSREPAISTANVKNATSQPFNAGSGTGELGLPVEPVVETVAEALQGAHTPPLGGVTLAVFVTVAGGVALNCAAIV